MAIFVFGMMQSLDGYVAGVPGGPQLPPPGPALHQYFNDHMRGLAGGLYGRRMYEVMRYWDADDSDWDSADNKWGAVERDFATVWRTKPKWVVSHSLREVGPNATLIGADVEAAVRRLKAEVDGAIDVAGPELAAALGAMGLIDEYRLFLRPVVLGAGKPFFAEPHPPLRLKASEIVADETVRLTYVPE
jgi:dihydrofolate reductase